MITEMPTAPCRFCPYRKDVPAGIWHPGDYKRLPAYDRRTAEQPEAAFACHKRPEQMCGGWAHHANYDTLALTILVIVRRRFTAEQGHQISAYSSPVPVFDSHTAAAEHGLAGCEDDPSAETLNARRKLLLSNPRLIRQYLDDLIQENP